MKRQFARLRNPFGRELRANLKTIEKFNVQSAQDAARKTRIGATIDRAPTTKHS